MISIAALQKSHDALVQINEILACPGEHREGSSPEQTLTVRRLLDLILLWHKANERIKELEEKCELYLRTNKTHLDTMLVQSKHIKELEGALEKIAFQILPMGTTSRERESFEIAKQALKGE